MKNIGKYLSLGTKLLAIVIVVVGMFTTVRSAIELITIGSFIGGIFLPVDVSKIINNVKRK